MKGVFVFLLALAASHPAFAGPEQRLLFLGSSTVEFWKSLATDFPDHLVVNKGVGGTDYEYVIKNAEPWLKQYPSKGVVLYSGDNDTDEGDSPSTVAANFEKAAELVHKVQPGADVYVISIKPSPSRAKEMGRVKEANALIQAETKKLGFVTYIDVFTPMLGKDGQARVDLFREDHLHMKPAGYALWKEVVGKAVRAREEAEKRPEPAVTAPRSKG